MEEPVPTSDVLSASLEDYLEAIYHIVQIKQAARAKDVVQRLGVKNSSVTGAMRALADKGLINYAPHDVITLTADGRRISEDVVRRHEALRDFFVKVLSLEIELADAAACSMEHALPAKILVRLTQFLKFAESRPDFLDEFHREGG
jgi:DtxR family Mn-dependent transcriptional regulator